jgi:hypothetical protein
MWGHLDGGCASNAIQARDRDISRGLGRRRGEPSDDRLISQSSFAARAGRFAESVVTEGASHAKGAERMRVRPLAALERFPIERNRSIDQNSLERKNAGAVSDPIGSDTAPDPRARPESKIATRRANSMKRR